MSRANARSGIEDEYEEAKETARVYLEAVGVLGPDEDSTSEYREPETRIPLDAIMQKTGSRRSSRQFEPRWALDAHVSRA